MAVYLPDPWPVELLLHHWLRVVLSLWRGVSLTVSLPRLGGRVKHELDGVRDGLLDNSCLNHVVCLDCFYLWDARFVRASSRVSSRFRLARTKRLSVKRGFNELSKLRIQV